MLEYLTSIASKPMSTSKPMLSIAVFAFLLPLSAECLAQGYYQRNVQRNPVTGRLQVVPMAPNGYGSTFGSGRSNGNFYGSRFNPYSGTAAESRVRRNPVTGRLNVDNRYYNPWTGAEVQTATRYNPYTGRYETVRMVVPPNQPLPQGDNNAPANAAASTGQPQPKPNRPRVIETSPPPVTDAPPANQ